MIGYQILAEALAKQNLEHCYGIVGMYFFNKGIPVIELGFAIQGAGIKYYGLTTGQLFSRLYWLFNWKTRCLPMCFWSRAY